MCGGGGGDGSGSEVSYPAEPCGGHLPLSCVCMCVSLTHSQLVLFSHSLLRQQRESDIAFHVLSKQYSSLIWREWDGIGCETIYSFHFSSHFSSSFFPSALDCTLRLFSMMQQFSSLNIKRLDATNIWLSRCCPFHLHVLACVCECVCVCFGRVHTPEEGYTDTPVYQDFS